MSYSSTLFFVCGAGAGVQAGLAAAAAGGLRVLALLLGLAPGLGALTAVGMTGTRLPMNPRQDRQS